MSGAAKMRPRAIIAVIAVAGAFVVGAGFGASSARAAATCTWGGTAAEPTGTFTLKPGITNTPSTEPLQFKATGELGGDAGCTGKFSYTGQFDTGSTCALGSFHGIAEGLPGVVRFSGLAPVGIAPALLYDAHGNVVGSENAQVDTVANAPHFTDCNTPEGFTGGNFSSVIELFFDLG